MTQQIDARRRHSRSAFIRVCLGVGVALVLHLMLRPFFPGWVADDLPMVAAIAIVLVKIDHGDAPVTRPEWLGRGAAALAIAAVVTVVYRWLNNLPEIWAAIHR